MPTNTSTRIWNDLQLLLPSQHHAILTNHTCQEEGPLAILCGDLHHRPKGIIDTIDLFRASITVLYVTRFQMRALDHSGAHHTPFLQLLEWPQCRLFHRYLTQMSRATGSHLLDNKDMKTAYRDFRAQHRCSVPATAPYTRIGLKHEPNPPLTGQVPLLTLPLTSSEAKPTRTTIIRHGAKWRIPKYHMTPQDPLMVPQDSQQMVRICHAGDPIAPTTPSPVLHLIARNHTHCKANLPTQAYVWVTLWFHQADANRRVAWNPDHKRQLLFTATPTWPRPDPPGIAICYSMHATGRTGKHKDPYYPLHH